MNNRIIPDLSDYISSDSDSFYERFKNIFDSPAEAKVYKLLYKLTQIDCSYKVRYGYYFHPDGSYVYPGGQIDFLVYKENVGIALLEIKGGKYLKNEKYIEAQNQVRKANYKLNSKIKVYNIIMFPDDRVPDNESNDDSKEYILDINDYNWFLECNINIVNFFDKFFSHKRYKNSINGTDQFVSTLFDLDEYHREREKERAAKEAILIDYKVKSIDLIADNEYNCFYLTGYSGTGKTFIAMNLAIESEKDVLFIVRNEELFNSIYTYFVKNSLAIINDYVWVKNDKQYRNHSYTEFRKISGKKLFLFHLDINVNSMRYKKDFSANGDLFNIIEKCNLIFIDEVQDASYYEIKTLLQLTLQDNEKTLYLIGDYSQFTNLTNVNEFDKIQKLLLEYIKEKKMLKLDLRFNNCRNDIEIKDLIYKLVNPDYVYQEIISGIKVHFVKGSCELSDSMLDSLVTVKEIRDSKIIFLTNISSDRYSKFITKKYGIKKFEHKISYNLSKGNEYNTVVVMGAEIKNLLDKNIIDRNILSLAAGRAKENLTLVFYINDDEERLKIIEILKGIYQFDECCFID